MNTTAFVDRAFAHLPALSDRFTASSWKHPGRTTAEAVGVAPQSNVDIERVVARILDVDHYETNIDFVNECRRVADSRFAEPGRLRFYQRIKLPVIGSIHMECLMEDLGLRDGWRVVAWTQLDAETERLDTRKGARFDYNDGAWLIREDAVGYALSSCPRKKDVGRLKFAAMTRGADATAGKMLEANIAGMVRWSRR